MFVFSVKKMGLRLIPVLSFMLLCFAPPAVGQGFDTSMLRNGDLIFQRSISPQAGAIMEATGSPLTHMGIIWQAPQGPMVIEAHLHVRAVPLRRWIRRGRHHAFSIRRMSWLTPPQQETMVRTALEYQGIDYDLMFSFDNETLYCSELPWLVLRRMGLSLGQVQTIGQLDLQHASVQRILKFRTHLHPACRGSGDTQACVQKILQQPLITPASLFADPRLVTVVDYPAGFGR